MPELHEMSEQDLEALIQHGKAALAEKAAEKTKSVRDEIDRLAESIAHVAKLTPKASVVPANRRGGKVAAQYRDPATGAEWTGRGMKPKWLQQRISEGRELAEFKIAKAA